MSFSRPIHWYHSHADPILPDGTFKRACVPECCRWARRGGKCQSPGGADRRQLEQQLHTDTPPDTHTHKIKLPDTSTLIMPHAASGKVRT
jgi:hypothetical protein